MKTPIPQPCETLEQAAAYAVQLFHELAALGEVSYDTLRFPHVRGAQLHRGLGTMLRNDLSLWHGAEKLKADIWRQMPEERQFILKAWWGQWAAEPAEPALLHADDASASIIERMCDLLVAEMEVE